MYYFLLATRIFHVHFSADRCITSCIDHLWSFNQCPFEFFAFILSFSLFLPTVILVILRLAVTDVLNDFFCILSFFISTGVLIHISSAQDIILVAPQHIACIGRFCIGATSAASLEFVFFLYVS